MWPARWGGSCNKEPLGRPAPPMTNRIALALAILVVIALLADRILTGGAAAFFLARKFLTLLDWIAFWR